MIETWRWFGPQDPITLADVRQTGATGVVTALHEVLPGIAWTAEDIAARKALIERAGLTWEVCESIPVPDAIKWGGFEAREAIGAWTDRLARLGRAGVPGVCYNFMPVVDWTRTALDHVRDDGAHALRFDPVDFAACDLFILGRDGAGDYALDLVAEAEARVAAMDAAARRRLAETVIAGLPGGAARRTPDDLLDEIAAFDGVTRDDVAAALVAFLQAVVTVAEEVGVRLAIHPDDPPVPLFELPRVVSTAEDAEAVLRAVDSPANGLTFCTGSYGAGGQRRGGDGRTFRRARVLRASAQRVGGARRRLRGGRASRRPDRHGAGDARAPGRRTCRRAPDPFPSGSRPPLLARGRGSVEPRIFLYRPPAGPRRIARHRRCAGGRGGSRSRRPMTGLVPAAGGTATGAVDRHLEGETT